MPSLRPARMCCGCTPKCGRPRSTKTAPNPTNATSRAAADSPSGTPATESSRSAATCSPTSPRNCSGSATRPTPAPAGVQFTGDESDDEPNDQTEDDEGARFAAILDDRTRPQRLHDALALALGVAARSGDLPTIGGAAPTLIVMGRAEDLAADTGWATIEGCDEPVSPSRRPPRRVRRGDPTGHPRPERPDRPARHRGTPLQPAPAPRVRAPRRRLHHPRLPRTRRMVRIAPRHRPRQRRPDPHRQRCAALLGPPPVHRHRTLADPHEPRRPRSPSTPLARPERSMATRHQIPHPNARTHRPSHMTGAPAQPRRSSAPSRAVRAGYLKRSATTRPVAHCAGLWRCNEKGIAWPGRPAIPCPDWCPRLESNQRPLVPETNALSPELRRRTDRGYHRAAGVPARGQPASAVMTLASPIAAMASASRCAR